MSSSNFGGWKMKTQEVAKTTLGIRKGIRDGCDGIQCLRLAGLLGTCVKRAGAVPQEETKGKVIPLLLLGAPLQLWELENGAHPCVPGLTPSLEPPRLCPPICHGHRGAQLQAAPWTPSRARTCLLELWDVVLSPPPWEAGGTKGMRAAEDRPLCCSWALAPLRAFPTCPP